MNRDDRCDLNKRIYLSGIPGFESERNLSIQEISDGLILQGIQIDSIHFLSEGWDFFVYELNHKYILRIPKRQDLVLRIDDELSRLETLSKCPFFDVPDYSIDIRRCTHFDWYIWGYKKLSGASFHQSDHRPLETSLIKGIHWFHHNLPTSAQMYCHDWDDYNRQCRQTYLKIRNKIPSMLRKVCVDILSKNLVCDDVFVSIHGDLRPDHIIVSENTFSIIDWTDISRGHPWEDFLWLWMFFGDDILSFCSENYPEWKIYWLHNIHVAAGWKAIMEFYYGLETSDDSKLIVSIETMKRLVYFAE